AETLLLAAGRQRHLGAATDDQAPRQVVVQRVLPGEIDVADAAVPCAGDVPPEAERHVDLVLCAPAEALLEEELLFDFGFLAAVDRGGEHRLVFRERL